MDQADPGRQQIQKEILAQLKKMPDRLDKVEEHISVTSQNTGQASTSSSGLEKLSRETTFSDSSKSSPSKN